MSRLEDAARRLELSVGRLEAAVNAGRAPKNGAGAVSAEEHARLEAVTEAVSARLDDAIVRLKRVLES